MLGMALFRSKPLMAAFSRPHVIHVAVSFVCIHFARHSFAHLPDPVAEVLLALSRAYIAATLSSMLFFLFGKLVPGKNDIAMYLSDAAYSVYLFHFITVYTLATPLKATVGNGEILLWIVAPLTLLITLLIHHFLILKFRFLRAAFNGKFPALGKARTATAPQAAAVVVIDR